MPIHLLTLPRRQWDKGIGQREDCHDIVGQTIELVPRWHFEIKGLKVGDDIVEIQFLLPQWEYGLFKMLLTYTNPFKNSFEGEDIAS